MQQHIRKATNFLENCYYLTDNDTKRYILPNNNNKLKEMYINHLILLAIYQQQFNSILNVSEYLEFCNSIKLTGRDEVIVAVARFKQYKIINEANNEIVDLSFLFKKEDDVLDRSERQYKIEPLPKLPEPERTQPPQPAPAQKLPIKRITPKSRNEDWER